MQVLEPYLKDGLRRQPISGQNSIHADFSQAAQAASEEEEPQCRDRSWPLPGSATSHRQRMEALKYTYAPAALVGAAR